MYSPPKDFYTSFTPFYAFWAVLQGIHQSYDGNLLTNSSPLTNCFSAHTLPRAKRRYRNILVRKCVKKCIGPFLILPFLNNTTSQKILYTFRIRKSSRKSRKNNLLPQYDLGGACPAQFYIAPTPAVGGFFVLLTPYGGDKRGSLHLPSLNCRRPSPQCLLAPGTVGGLLALEFVPGVCLLAFLSLPPMLAHLLFCRGPGIIPYLIRNPNV